MKCKTDERPCAGRGRRGIRAGISSGQFFRASHLSIYHVERKERERHDEPLLRFFLIELKFDRSTAVRRLYADVHAGIME